MESAPFNFDMTTGNFTVSGDQRLHFFVGGLDYILPVRGLRGKFSNRKTARPARPMIVSQRFISVVAGMIKCLVVSYLKRVACTPGHAGRTATVAI
jgi:hypothetical protein